MAKYVCDFDSVIAVGNKLISSANSLSSATSTYSSSIDSDLSGWDGVAKSAFASQKETLVSNNMSKAQYASEFGEFLIEAANSIQELEESLSGLSI